MNGYTGTWTRFVSPELEAKVKQARMHNSDTEIWDKLVKDNSEIKTALSKGAKERDIIDSLGLNTPSQSEKVKIIDREFAISRQEYKPPIEFEQAFQRAGIVKPPTPLSQAPKDKTSESISPTPPKKKLSIFSDYDTIAKETLKDYLKKEKPLSGRATSFLGAITPHKGTLGDVTEETFPWANFAGQMAKYATAGSLTHGVALPYADQLVQHMPNIGVNPATVARAIAESAEWGATFAVPKLVENLSAVASGEKPTVDNLLLEPMSEGIIGGLIGPTTLIPNLGTRMAAKGVSRVGAGLIAELIKDGVIDKEDIKKSLLMGIISSGIELTKGHKKALENSLKLELDKKIASGWDYMHKHPNVSPGSIGKELVAVGKNWGERKVVQEAFKEFLPKKGDWLSKQYPTYLKVLERTPRADIPEGLKSLKIKPRTSYIKTIYNPMNILDPKASNIMVKEFQAGVKAGMPTQDIFNNMMNPKDYGSYRTQLDKLPQGYRWNIEKRNLDQKAYAADKGLTKPLGLSKPTSPVVWNEPASGEIFATENYGESTTLAKVRYSEHAFRRNVNAYYGVHQPFKKAEAHWRNTANAYINEERRLVKELKITPEENRKVGTYRTALGRLSKLKYRASVEGRRIDVSEAKRLAKVVRAGLNPREKKFSDFLQEKWDYMWKLRRDEGRPLKYEHSYFTGIKHFIEEDYRQATGHQKVSGPLKQWWEFHKEGTLKNSEKNASVAYEKYVKSFFKDYYFSDILDNANKNVLDKLPPYMNELSRRYIKRMQGYPSEQQAALVAGIRSVMEAAGSWTPFTEKAIKKAAQKVTINTTMDVTQFLLDDTYLAVMGGKPSSVLYGFLRPLANGVPEIGPSWMSGGLVDLLKKGLRKDIGTKYVGRETLPVIYQELKLDRVPSKISALREFGLKGYSATYNMGRQVCGYAADNKFTHYIGDMDRGRKLNETKAINRFMNLTRADKLNIRPREQIRLALLEKDYNAAKSIYNEEIVGKVMFRFGKGDSPDIAGNSLGKLAMQLASTPNNYAELLTDWVVNKNVKALTLWGLMSGGIYELAKRRVLNKKLSKRDRTILRSFGTGPLMYGFGIAETPFALEPIEQGVQAFIRNAADPEYNLKKRLKKIGEKSFASTYIPFWSAYNEIKDY